MELPVPGQTVTSCLEVGRRPHNEMRCSSLRRRSTLETLLQGGAVFHRLTKPGRSEEGPSRDWPSGSPASPRFTKFSRVKDKRDGWCLVSPAAVPGWGDLALPGGYILCSGRHQFMSLFSTTSVSSNQTSLPILFL